MHSLEAHTSGTMAQHDAELERESVCRLATIWVVT
jgi:hypothetical protein